MNLHDHIDALQSVLTDVVPDADERLRLAIITAGTQQLIDKLSAARQQAEEILDLLHKSDGEDARLFYPDELDNELEYVMESLDMIDLEGCLTPLDSHTLLQENAA